MNSIVKEMNVYPFLNLRKFVYAYICLGVGDIRGRNSYLNNGLFFCAGTYAYRNSNPLSLLSSHTMAK